MLTRRVHRVFQFPSQRTPQIIAVSLGSRDYHSSASLFAGRKGGSQVNVAAPRDFSKKQKQRYRRRVEALKEKEKTAEGGMKKVGDSYLKEQMETPQMKNYIEKMSDEMLAPLRDMMLPDGVQMQIAAKEEIEHMALPSVYDVVLRLQEQAAETGATSTSDSMALISTDTVTSEEANQALLAAYHENDAHITTTLLDLMKEHSLNLTADGLTAAMRTYVACKQYNIAESLFNASMDREVLPNLSSWELLIEAKARQLDVEGAEKTLERLKSLAIMPSMPMLNSILRAKIETRQLDAANEYWAYMHSELAEFNVESFELMMKYCCLTYQTERAFFLADEMRCYDIQPSQKLFAELFLACADAPHFVNGYQDIIFDAMCVMEGYEMMPNTEIYNNIIYSFGKAGDPWAAEFYFWEMRRKGLEQDVTTYNNMFKALALAQRIGCSKYPQPKRYVRPPPKISEEERILLKAGPVTAFDVASRDTTSSKSDRGKRTKAVFEPHFTDDNHDEYIEEVETAASDQEDKYEAWLQANKGFQDYLENERAVRDPKIDLIGRAKDMGLPTSKPRVLPSESDLDSSGSDTEDEDYLNKQLEDGRNNFDSDDDENDGVAMKSNAQFEQASNVSPEELKRQAAEFMNSNDELDMEDMDDTDLEKLAAGDPFLMRFVEKMKNNEVFEDSDFDGLIDEAKAGVAGAPDVENMLANLKAQLGEDSGDIGDLQMNEAQTADYNKAISNRLQTTRERATLTPEQQRRVDEATSATATAPWSLLPSEGANQPEMDMLVRMLDNEVPPPSIARPEEEFDPKYVPKVITGQFSLDDRGVVSQDEVTRQWEMVYFGRARNPDYSQPVPVRRIDNIAKAEALYKDMMDHGVAVNEETLANYMQVYSEMGDAKKAQNIIDLFDRVHDVKPRELTHQALVRMNIYGNNIDGAIEVVRKMSSLGIADKNSYGMVVRSLTHRKDIVGALKMVEDAHKDGLTLSNRYVKLLRTTCENMGLTHPHLIPDPHEWVKDVKRIRKEKKNLKRSVIQRASSYTFKNS